MTSNGGLNYHLTCLVYLPYLQNFIKIMNLASNYTYPNAKKLSVKL